MTPEDSFAIASERRALLPALAISAPIAVGGWLGLRYLAPPLAGMDAPFERLFYALGWGCIAILLCFLTGIEAVAHRRLFSRAIDPLAGVESPALRVDLRYLQHTLEQLLLFLPGLLALAWYADAGSIHAVTATAIVWIAARWAFWIGYHRGSRFRSAGLTGMVQSIVVLLYVVFRFGQDLGGLAGGLAPIAIFLAIEARLFQLARREGRPTR